MTTIIARRKLLAAFGGAAFGWPLAARAQQPAMPVVGFVNGGSPIARHAAAFRKGLSEAGYVEGQNVAITIMLNPDSISSQRLAASAAAAAQKFAVEVVAMPAREPAEIATALAALAGERGDGLIVPPDPATNTHRKAIVELAAAHRLPAIYGLRSATAEGGLMSYGVDLSDLFRKAAVYADRILKGEKPADLPVQQPTRFEMVVNLRAAKALGLEIPPTLLALADEVIE
jgi:putative tryptophan/tyrosine transport system substrate-binding protein